MCVCVFDFFFITSVLVGTSAHSKNLDQQLGRYASHTKMLFTGFLVDDVYKFSDALLAAGVPFHKVCLALLTTPDMYVFCGSALN